MSKHKADRLGRATADMSKKYLVAEIERLMTALQRIADAQTQTDGLVFKIAVEALGNCRICGLPGTALTSRCDHPEINLK